MTRRLALWFAAALAAPAGAADRTHDITPDDYASLAMITEVAVSPGGKHVAYALATFDKADDARKTDLWVVGVDDKKPARLTFDRANDRHPKWAADGKAVYVLGNRKREGEKKPPYDGTTQVWRVSLDGGTDPRAVTKVEGGVTGFDYSPDADALFFTTDATATDDDEFAKLRAKTPKNEFGHGTRKVSEVHKLDLQTWRVEKVYAEKRYVREFAVTRDGKKLALVTAADDTVIRSEGESRVDVWEAGKVTTPPTDVYRKKAASPYAWLEGFAWNPDGTRFAFCAIFDAYPAEVVIGTAGKGGWGVELMPREKGVQVRGYGSPLRWNEFGGLSFLADAAGTVGPREYNPVTKATGPRTDAWGGAVVYATGRGGDTVFSVAGDQGFAELFALRSGKDTDFVRLSRHNAHTETWKLPAVSHVTWKAPDGATVGGVLELPFGYKKGDKLPLVVAIHGGPTTASYADQRFDPHNGRLYLAAAGYVVLCPNYRGSTGYGDKFLTDLVGNENDLDVKDIVAGIQHLVKEGIADPDRVGVMGWSNGGYLTNCLITMKDPAVKIKGASSGAGIVDTVAEWGFNDEPAYPIVFKKGLPWEQPDVYKRTSPTYGLGNVKTPTLIHVGGNDERCPPGHSRMLYRALRENLKVPTELVVYAGEPHGLTKLSNRKAKMEWDLAWFDKYVKGAK